MVNRHLTPLRSFIKKWYPRFYLSYFGTRPAKIFSKEIRIGLAFGKKQKISDGKIFTTRALLFSKNERPKLFNDLIYEDTSDLELGRFIGDNQFENTILPKIGSTSAKNILHKLKLASKNNQIGKKLVPNGIKIDIRTTGVLLVSIYNHSFE